MTQKAEIIKTEFSVDMFTITQLSSQAQRESQALVGSSIETDDDAREASEHLREWLRKLDKVKAMKAETLAPLKEASKRIDALFKPLIDAGAALTDGVREMLETYELGKRAAQRKALAEAAAVACNPEPAPLLEALQRVEDAAPTELDGTAFVRTWEIKHICEDLLLDEYWIVDRARIEKTGKAAHGDKPPVIPGVIWVEKLSSRVRR
jgi:phosphoglycolate phosphatase-like HAD superfamily hydrolase